MQEPSRRLAVRAGLVYFVIALVWSSTFERLWSSPAGDGYGLWEYIAGDGALAVATALLLYVLLRRELAAREHAERRLSQASSEMTGLAGMAGQQASQLNALFRSMVDAVTVHDMTGRLTNANPAARELLGLEASDSTSITLADMPPIAQRNGVAVALADLPVARALRGETVRDEIFTCRSCKGEQRVYVVTAAPLLVGEQLRGAVQVFHDVTEREQLLAQLESRVQQRTRELAAVNEQLEQRVAERTQEFATLLEVARDLTSTLELRPLLELILDRLRVLVDYNIAALIAPQGQEFVMLGYRGPAPLEQALTHHFSHANLPSYRMVRESSAPLLIPDISADGVVAAALDDTGRLLCGGAGAWMDVPVMIKGRMAAMLHLQHDQPHHFTEYHERMTLAIVTQAAVAIENARLYQEAQRVAVLEERQRLARDLHDSIAQTLYGIVLDVQSALDVIQANPDQAAALLDNILALAEASRVEMRALIFELRPDSLEQDGLVSALAKLAGALQSRDHILIVTQLEGEPRISLAAKEGIYRIAQEALNNVAKHAQATRAELRLSLIADGVVLEVSDDGVGFDPAQFYPGHMGLQSMQERASRLKGSFDVRSTEGQGTLVRVQIPFS